MAHAGFSGAISGMFGKYFLYRAASRVSSGRPSLCNSVARDRNPKLSVLTCQRSHTWCPRHHQQLKRLRRARESLVRVENDNQRRIIGERQLMLA